MTFLLLCGIFVGLEVQGQSHLQEAFEVLAPYFLPEDHPIKARLDWLFSHVPVLKDRRTFVQSGFLIVSAGIYSHVTVAQSQLFPGYFFKCCFDDQKIQVGWEHWKQRIIAARAIEACIDGHGWNDLFKVPKKWIYPLPEPLYPIEKRGNQLFLLIAEDMQLVRGQVNLQLWRSDKITGELLDTLYQLLQEEGLSDAVYAFNLPFAKDGKIALIDTEHHQEWPVNFSRLLQYLSLPMQNHWQHLIEKGKRESLQQKEQGILTKCKDRFMTKEITTPGGYKVAAPPKKTEPVVAKKMVKKSRTLLTKADKKVRGGQSPGEADAILSLLR